MKTSKKILLTALSATLATTLTSGIALTAYADTATKDHAYDAKFDAVFEDFDRADISDTVKNATDGTVNLGEKPYLHVKFTAGGSNTADNAIYKQALGDFEGKLANGTNEVESITFKMRSPDESVELSELKFIVRVNDVPTLNEYTFTQLNEDLSGELKKPTTEWQDYEINLKELYPAQSSAIVGFHLVAADATAEGTLDIDSVCYSEANKCINDFVGSIGVESDVLKATALNSAAGGSTYWAGSQEGVIVQRNVNITNGSFEVVKDNAVGDYAYAIIEAEGDVANLQVATTTDGTTWGTEAAYDGYSVNLTGTEKGFKFIYGGTAEGGVTVKRIYLTNLVTETPATAVPVIDASTADVLEDFSVAQSGFTDNYDAMVSATEAAGATDLWYRLSGNNGDKVEVKDGVLEFAGAEDNGYINFKFNSKNVHKGQYVVLKMKGEEGSSLKNFRFALISANDSEGTTVSWVHDWKSGVGFPAATALDETNPYNSDGWSYIVVDIERSGLKVCKDGYTGMNLYCGDGGKLYIDSIFFADKLANVEEDFTDNGVDFAGTLDGYAYAGGFALNNKYGTATSFSFDITPKDDNFDPSNLRLGLGAGVFWASDNLEGKLITKDNKLLTELTYTKGQATHIDIDLEASKIGAFDFVHVHVGAIGGFTLNNVKLHTSTQKEDYKELSEKVVALENTFVNNLEAAKYTYVGGADVAYGAYGKLEFTVTPGADFDATDFRVQIKNGDMNVKEIWVAQYGEPPITADGKKYADIDWTNPVTFSFNLLSIDAAQPINQFHVHSTGSLTGAFTVSGVKLTALKDNYAEQLGLLPVYLDTTDPTVSITTATTATAGDEITVAYTAADDLTAAADLNVTVSVTKDGNAVTLTGNKFTAQEGVYTVTVTVRDQNGNEASDTIQITVSAAKGGDTGLSTGAIAGIVIGCVAAVTAVGVAVYFIVRKKKNS